MKFKFPWELGQSVIRKQTNNDMDKSTALIASIYTRDRTTTLAIILNDEIMV